MIEQMLLEIENEINKEQIEAAQKISDLVCEQAGPHQFVMIAFDQK